MLANFESVPTPQAMLGRVLSRNQSGSKSETPDLPLTENFQEPTWDEAVVQCGKAIKALRAEQALTLQQIHAQTKVPLYHLRALEDGNMERMPEAIFVHGFLKRICAVLGDEGLALLVTLPQPQLPTLTANKAQSSPAACALNATHLYVGYAALLAGSVGGLAWLEQSQASYSTTPPDNTQVQEAGNPISSPQAKRWGAASSQERSQVMTRDMSLQQLNDVQQEMLSPEFS